jgi:hypothetical protein
VQARDLERLMALAPHGIVGQSWRKQPRASYDFVWQSVEGALSDYRVTDGPYGQNFAFNRFGYAAKSRHAPTAPLACQSGEAAAPKRSDPELANVCCAAVAPTVLSLRVPAPFSAQRQAGRAEQRRHAHTLQPCHATPLVARRRNDVQSSKYLRFAIRAEHSERLRRLHRAELRHRWCLSFARKGSNKTNMSCLRRRLSCSALD